MKAYFDKLTQVVTQESCYRNYQSSEVIITDAMNILNLLSNEADESKKVVLRDAFKSACENEQCGHALSNLLHGLNGQSIFGCDLLQMTFDGDASSPLYYTGWMDQVAQKAGYFVTLAQLAFTVEAAYYSVKYGEGQSDIVQQLYGEQMQSATQRAIDIINRCKSTDTLEMNFNRAMNFQNLNGDSPNGQVKDVIATLLDTVYSYKRSYVLVYDNMNGFDNHASCGTQNNIVKLHF